MDERGRVPLPAIEYELLRGLIRQEFGIDYPPNKRELLRLRLEGRLRALGVQRFADYYRLLRHAPRGQPEWQALGDCITDNETYFFREGHQFTPLAEVASRWAGVPGAPFRALS